MKRFEQYSELKAKHPQAVILIREGDFYECYEKDAEAVSEICSITLTKIDECPFTMFPFHALDTYLPKIIRAGHRVAICEEIN